MNTGDQPAFPVGHRFIDGNSGREMVLITEGHAKGWIAYRHPDGQWVSLRVATDIDRHSILSRLDKERGER